MILIDNNKNVTIEGNAVDILSNYLVITEILFEKIINDEIKEEINIEAIKHTVISLMDGKTREQIFKEFEDKKDIENMKKDLGIKSIKD